MSIRQILEEVNAEFVEDWGSPYEINNGGCEEWADEVMDRLRHTDNSVEVWATPYFFADTTHSFVRINGKFIDAECLDGVDDHNDLPIFKRLIEKGCKRQPVWCEDANHDSLIAGDSCRDIPPDLRKDIRQEQLDSGVEPERALSLA